MKMEAIEQAKKLISYRNYVADELLFWEKIKVKEDANAFCGSYISDEDFLKMLDIAKESLKNRLKEIDEEFESL